MIFLHSNGSQLVARSAARAAVIGAFATSCLTASCGGTGDVDRTVRNNPSTLVLPSTLSCEGALEEFEFLALDSFEKENVHSSPYYWYVSEDGTNGILGAENEADGPQFGPVQGLHGSKLEMDYVQSSEGGAPSLSGEGTPCRMSERAMHLYSSGKGFDDWGFNFGTNVEAGTDATAANEWDGVAFWIRREVGSDSHAAYFAVKDAHTGDNQSDDSTTAVDERNCWNGLFTNNLCDPFGSGVSATREEWQLALLPFSEMIQRGFGKEFETTGPDTATINNIGFYIEGKTWDMWVDELSFYRKR